MSPGLRFRYNFSRKDVYLLNYDKNSQLNASSCLFKDSCDIILDILRFTIPQASIWYQKSEIEGNTQLAKLR